MFALVMRFKKVFVHLLKKWTKQKRLFHAKMVRDKSKFEIEEETE